MDENTVRILVGLAVLVHGIGHVMGWFPIFGWSEKSGVGWKPDSWLLTRSIGLPASKVLGFLIWTSAAVMAIMAGLAALGWLVPVAWFKDLAVWSSAVSLGGLFLFPNAFATTFNKLGAIAVDLILLVSLLWVEWPPVSGIG
jgi:hypothetical protein